MKQTADPTISEAVSPMQLCQVPNFTTGWSGMQGKLVSYFFCLPSSWFQCYNTMSRWDDTWQNTMHRVLKKYGQFKWWQEALTKIVRGIRKIVWKILQLTWSGDRKKKDMKKKYYNTLLILPTVTVYIQQAVVTYLCWLSDPNCDMREISCDASTLLYIAGSTLDNQTQ